LNATGEHRVADVAGFLDEDRLRAVIGSAPLVSIDFLIRNESNEFLLGKRLNKPAQGLWFVPGGRIRKMERLEGAINRISEAELGINIKLEDSEFVGIFEHMYGDSVFSDCIETHYVSIGFLCDLPSPVTSFPMLQHSRFQWFGVEEIESSAEVHPHTKEFFNESFGIR